MEIMGEDLQVQVFALSHNAPNQEISLLNEDVAIATEVVTEKPELVEIEKELVIQKRFIVKEKILVPKKMVTFPPNHSLEGHISLFGEKHDKLVYNEVGSQDSEEFSKMEVASQESIDSRMDISSQESYLSHMECSSQEVDVLTKPISDDCMQSKGKLSIQKETCKAKSYQGNSTPIKEAKVSSIEESTSEKCLWPENDFQIGKGSVPNEEEEILKEIFLQNEVIENNLSAEGGVLKRKAGTLADGMPLRSERSLLSREEAVAARETACTSREKAIKDREAALVSQRSSFAMAPANDSPSPKRMKLIGIFECS